MATSQYLKKNKFDIVGNKLLEPLLALYLCSGIMKSILGFYNIHFPIDLTVGSAFLLLISTFLNVTSLNRTIHKSKYVREVLAVFILFYIWMIISMIYSTSEIYSIQKCYLFFTTFLPILIIYLCKRFDIRLFVAIFSLITLCISLIYLPLKGMMNLGRYSSSTIQEQFESINGLYLSCANILGINVLVLLSTHVSIFNKTIDRIILALSLILLLLMGARGPILFVIISTMFFYVFVRRQAYKFVKITLYTICFILIVVTVFSSNEIFSSLLERSIGRMDLILDGLFDEKSSMGSSVDTRLDFISISFNHILSNLGNLFFGSGVGSFGIEVLHQDIRAYPHNILLEIWFEMGLIGVLIFFSFIYIIIKSCKSPHNIINICLLLYIFLNWMKSSSLVDLRTDMAFIVLSMSIWNQNIMISNSKRD